MGVSLVVCALVVVVRGASGGSSFHATESRDCAAASFPIERVDAAAMSGARLLADFVLRDVPVVLEGAVDAAALARLDAAGHWDPGATPAWARGVLGGLAAAADGAISFRNESTRRGGDRWGCRGSAKQCQVAWWYAGASKTGARAGAGATVHTDAVCAPSWALQVAGGVDLETRRASEVRSARSPPCSTRKSLGRDLSRHVRPPSRTFGFRAFS